MEGMAPVRQDGSMSDISIVPVSYLDARAVALREAMDVEIGARYADRFGSTDVERAAELNRAFAIDPATMVATFIVEIDGVPAAHAALRRLERPGAPGQADVEWELKRLVTLAAHRGRGLSRLLIRAVEDEARRRGASRLILQTGDRQPEAVRLYDYLGYRPIPIYEPYTVMAESLCFERAL